MRLLVVTLHTIEREFDRSLQSIASQTYREFDHLVISGLSKREAHHKMYGTFVDRRDEFEVLVKIDADMVLNDVEFFAKVVEKFRNHGTMDLLSIKVHDFFTDRPTWGLNCYRNNLAWKSSSDLVFTDRVDVPRERTVFDKSDLAPAATHCSDPSPFQAFHFGMHRGVKARVAVERHMPEVLESRLRDIDGTWNHFLEKRDIRLALAALGGELGITGRFTDNDISYTNPTVLSVFGEYEHLSVADLQETVQSLRRASWGWLPTRLRVEALRGEWGTFPFRCLISSRTRRRWARRFNHPEQSINSHQNSGLPNID